MPQRTITYHYRGSIEVPDGRGSYKWTDGYSETTDDGNVVYPWVTSSECRKDAKARGARAILKSQ